MKFKFGDRVTVISGFYEGRKGVVIRYHVNNGNSDNSYAVDIARYVNTEIYTASIEVDEKLLEKD